MAITQTGAMYKSLTFDNKTSREYGVYITGEAVYNAPARDVEMITIPGRNGSFALDNGRFENIEVSYPAGIYADTEADFRQAISDFRNFLCSRKGYVRLQDEYNPNEYRMAVYKSGLDVDPAQLRAGEFDIVFDCKPQRWLTSGETKTSVSSGSTVTNPTRFDASPLIEVEGYGNLLFNGHTISIENAVMGEVLLANSKTYSAGSTDLIFNKLSYETGDTITLAEGTISWDARLINGYLFYTPSVTATDSDTRFVSRADIAGRLKVITNRETLTFTAGTSKTVTNTATASLRMSKDGQVSDMIVTCTQTITYTPNYSSTQSRIRIQCSLSFSSSGKLEASFYTSSSKTGDITVSSTQSLLGHPTYIDCDLGEAYKITSGVYVSLNSKINLGSKLPTLASGSNTVTYDNTITSVKITPRWWKV